MYVKKADMTVMSFVELRLAFPHVAFSDDGPDGAWLKDNGFPILKNEPPSYNPETHILADGGIIEIDGEYRRDYSRREKSHDEKLSDVLAQRAAAYPPIGDQLDAIIKWLATETGFTVPQELKSIVDECMAVKSRHPKTEE